jgi:LuxR family maltose regulon positive regulatory protein
MELPAPMRARLLRPRMAADAVPRPRLVDRLMAGQERPLTLICAPAGYGKTTLLCQWIEVYPGRSVWLSLDTHDSDLASFLLAVVGALQTAWPAVGAEVVGLLRLPQTPPPDYLGAALADALLDLPEPMLLVLDDYQVISDASVHGLVATLLEHPVPGFHLVVTTRVDPPLPLPRLRVRDLVTEVRARDLAFTLEEAETFLTRAAGATLEPDVITLVEQRTEGWATGLRLAALSLRDQGDPARLARAFTGRRQRHALGFLLDEVLAKQPPELEAFLRRTAVTDRVCGPLCDALLSEPARPGQGAALLRQVMGADLFVTLLATDEGGREWVRYHPLFRELLLERLREREGPAVVTDLGRQAAAWFAAHGLVDEAVEALLAGDDLDGAARLVEDNIAAAMDVEDWPTLWRLLRRLPEQLVRRRPGLLLAHGLIDHMRGRLTSMAEQVQAATLLLDRHGSDLSAAEVQVWRALADGLTALIYLYQGDGVAAVEATRRAPSLA